MEDADDGFLLALHDADDPAFSFAIVAEPAHLDQHLVTVHGVADLRRRHKDVTLELALGARRQRAGLGDDEAVAIALQSQAALDQVMVGGGGGKAPALLADGDELAAAGHLAEKLLEVTTVAAFEAEVMDKLLEAGHVLGLFGNVMEDLLFR